MTNRAHIKEIFSSIQGEGQYIGEFQTFIRFCKCNLKCKYCDTNYKKDKSTKEYSATELANIVLHKTAKTISLTGGEPLLETEFLKEFLPLIKPHKKIYLETNGTLVPELLTIIEHVDIISADIKLKSATGQNNNFRINNEFFNVARRKKCFMKIVFDETITTEEIRECIEIAKENEIEMILQPKMEKGIIKANINSILETYNIIHNQYERVRLIPQMHKFLNIP